MRITSYQRRKELNDFRENVCKDEALSFTDLTGALEPEARRSSTL